MSIVKMYRKMTEKSRTRSKRTAWFLFYAAVILCVIFIFFGLFGKDIAGLRRGELQISRECEELFGGDTIAALVREFEKQNPELRIRLVQNGDQSSAPAVVFFEEGRFNSLVRQGALASLNPYMRTEAGGEHWAIPLVSFMDMLFYNIDMLRAAGFDRPPRTREEFLAYAKAVSKPEAGNPGGGPGVYGAALGLNPEDPLALRRDVFSWIWAAGGDFFPSGEEGEGEDKPRFGSRAALDVIAFLGQLDQEGALSPGTFAKTGADRADDFSRGKIAMMIASSRNIPLLREQMGGSAFGVTVIPDQGSAGKGRIGLSGIYAGISAGCARPEDAWVFLTFLAEQSPALAARLKGVSGTAASGGLPGVFPGSGAFSGGDTADPLYSKTRDIFEASELVRGFSGHPRGDDFEAAVREALRIFFERRRSPADTAADIQQRWDSL